VTFDVLASSSIIPSPILSQLSHLLLVSTSDKSPSKDSRSTVYPPLVGLDDLEDKFHCKPNLDTLYYNQTEAIVGIVSANLPPSLLLEKYNEVSQQASHLMHDTI
jgi:hypothetical protein